MGRDKINKMKLLCVVGLFYAVAALPTNSTFYSRYYAEWIKMAGFELSDDAVSASESAFIIVDMQNDFVEEYVYRDADLALDLSPCRALTNSSAACFGVKEGDAVANMIASVLDSHKFNSVWASADDHHNGHCSFSASAGSIEPPPWCDKMLRACHNSFTGCNGTDFIVAAAEGDTVKGPFPPHCLRGSPGAAIYSTVWHALAKYASKSPAAAAPKLVIKGLDVTTDSFGVLPYPKQSWQIYHNTGVFDRMVPAALIRSALTWEKHMQNSTGASSYTLPFSGDYVSTGPSFEHPGSNGDMYNRQSALDGLKHAEPRNIVVSGLAGDWKPIFTIYWMLRGHHFYHAI